MAKLAKRGTASTKRTVIDARNNPKAIEMFAGLTLAQVGDKFNLDESAARWYEPINPKTGKAMHFLLLEVNNTLFQIPLSKGFTDDMRTKWDVLPECLFRASIRQATERAADGTLTPKVDANKQPVMESYLNLGKPDGLVIDEDVCFDVFENAPEIAEDATADANKS